MMKMKTPIILIITGVVILIFGIVLAIIFDMGKYIAFTAGFGSSLIASGIFGLKPDNIRQREIERKDERFIRIREKSGYFAFIISMLVNIAIMVTVLIMDNFVMSVIVIIVIIVQFISYLVALYVNDRRM